MQNKITGQIKQQIRDAADELFRQLDGIVKDSNGKLDFRLMPFENGVVTIKTNLPPYFTTNPTYFNDEWPVERTKHEVDLIVRSGKKGIEIEFRAEAGGTARSNQRIFDPSEMNELLWQVRYYAWGKARMVSLSKVDFPLPVAS